MMNDITNKKLGKMLTEIYSAIIGTKYNHYIIEIIVSDSEDSGESIL